MTTMRNCANGARSSQNAEDSSGYRGMIRMAGRSFDEFSELGQRFQEELPTYRQDLQSALRGVFERNEVRDGLRDLGIDWATAHYVSRHPIPEGVTAPHHVRVGVPIGPDMKKHKKALTAYDSELSRYVDIFAKTVAVQGDPRYVVFHNYREVSAAEGDRRYVVLYHDGEVVGTVPASSLCIGESLTGVFVKITRGKESQGDVTREELDQLRKHAAKDDFTNIAKWCGKDISQAQGAGIVRDSCRVTLLALGLDDKKIRLPRVAVLAPAYAEGNIIGGVAFVGNAILDEVAVLVLGLFARNLLSTLRLIEERERERVMQDAETLSRARAEFVQRMGHAISNPLDVLRSSVRAAVKRLQAVDEAVGQLRESASHLIIAFAKEDVEDLLVVRRTSVPVKDFLDTLVFMHTKAYDDAHLKLTVGEIPDDWTMYVDSQAFYEVMANLLTNAAKYAKERVSLVVERDGMAMVVFRVRDDGPGVSPSVREDLFSPGVRVEGDPKNGHGYGLYFCRLIMEKHQGSIRLNDQVRDGAEFVVKVPTSPPNEGRIET